MAQFAHFKDTDFSFKEEKLTNLYERNKRLLIVLGIVENCLEKGIELKSVEKKVLNILSEGNCPFDDFLFPIVDSDGTSEWPFDINSFLFTLLEFNQVFGSRVYGFKEYHLWLSVDVVVKYLNILVSYSSNEYALLAKRLLENIENNKLCFLDRREVWLLLGKFKLGGEVVENTEDKSLHIDIGNEGLCGTTILLDEFINNSGDLIKNIIIEKNIVCISGDAIDVTKYVGKAMADEVSFRGFDSMFGKPGNYSVKDRVSKTIVEFEKYIEDNVCFCIKNKLSIPSVEDNRRKFISVYNNVAKKCKFETI